MGPRQARPGRYQAVAGNLHIKEVRIDGTGDRFVICHNPDAATRDAATRADLITKLEDMIAGSDKLSVTRRAELRGKISTMPGLNRFLRVTPGGLLRIDKATIKTEENLDGKYLLRSSDPKLSAEDIALGYKQLLQVERGWRDMKSVLDLHPVYHHLEERIRAHVILCWLALLLIRIIETTTLRHLARHPPAPRPPPHRHLHRPRRDIPPAHRADQGPDRPARQARHPRPQAHHRARTRPIRAAHRPACLEKRPRRVPRRVSPGHTADPAL